MKLLILFISLLFTAFDLLAMEPFRLSQMQTHTNLDPYMGVMVDTSGADTFQTVREEDFTPLSKMNYGISKSAVWTRTEIVNDTQVSRNIILFNPLPSMDEIDLFVYQNGKVSARYTLGDHRPIENNPLLYRLSGIPLEIAPGERVKIITRNYHSGGFNIVQWQIRSHERFHAFLVRDMLFWGVFIGTILALIVYNTGLFLALKERFFAFYALLALTSLTFQLSVNGVFHLFGFRLDNGLSFVYILLAGIFSLLFALSFFSRIASDYPILHRFARFMVAMTLLWDVMSVIEPFGEPLLAKGALLFTIVDFLLAFTIASVAVYRRYEGSFYFFAGQVAIFIAYFYQIAVRVDLIDTFYLSTYVVAICSFFDILFLSVAISRKIKRIELDRRNNEKMVAIQSRFAIMGKTTANILHQWRQPISHIGTIAMFIESVIREGKDETAKKLRPMIPKLHSTIDFMSHTVFEMSELYKSDTYQSEFEVGDSISRVLELLHEKIDRSDIQIGVHSESEIRITHIKNAFDNVLLSIIDNALDVVASRGVQNARIDINILMQRDNIIIDISDNAGGIHVRPIEAIFDPFISTKEQSNGLGLPIAKMLVQQKLAGSIWVENRKDGAIFHIVIPRRGEEKQ